MGESLVAFGHPVGFFFALDRTTRVLGGVQDLERKLLRHAFPAPLARETHDPPAREREPALRPDLDGHLVGGAADSPGLDLEQRRGIPEGRFEYLEGLLLRLPAGSSQRVVDDLL